MKKTSRKPLTSKMNDLVLSLKTTVWRDPTDPRYKDVESKALIASEREKRRAKKLAKLEKIREEMLKNGDNVTLDEDDDFPGSAIRRKDLPAVSEK